MHRADAARPVQGDAFALKEKVAGRAAGVSVHPGSVRCGQEAPRGLLQHRGRVAGPEVPRTAARALGFWGGPCPPPERSLSFQ